MEFFSRDEELLSVVASDGTRLQGFLLPAKEAARSAPLVVLMHGANYSARSFTLLRAKLAALGMSVLTYDARGHGGSDDGPKTTTLDASVLSSDCLAVVEGALAMLPLKAGDAPLPLALIGHSMGGAIASHIAAAWPRSSATGAGSGDAGGLAPSAPAAGVAAAAARVAARCQLACLVVIEMVESLALGALPHMRAMLHAMPHAFASAEAAVEWALASRTLRLRASAQLSVPYQLVPIRTGAAAAPAAAGEEGEAVSVAANGGAGSGGSAEEGAAAKPAAAATAPIPATAAASISREDSTADGPAASSGASPAEPEAAAAVPASAAEPEPEPTVEWRAWPFMQASVDCWRDWFAGTTARLLAAPCPKLLLLADAESLDGPLTVAQMQGKLQVRVIAGAGHVLHEDAPDKVGEAITAFLSRHGITREAEAALLAAKLTRAREQAQRTAAAAAVGAAAAAAGAARASAASTLAIAVADGAAAASPAAGGAAAALAETGAASGDIASSVPAPPAAAAPDSSATSAAP